MTQYTIERLRPHEKLKDYQVYALYNGKEIRATVSVVKKDGSWAVGGHAPLTAKDFYKRFNLTPVEALLGIALTELHSKEGSSVLIHYTDDLTPNSTKLFNRFQKRYGITTQEEKIKTGTPTHPKIEKHTHLQIPEDVFKKIHAQVFPLLPLITRSRRSWLKDFQRYAEKTHYPTSPKFMKLMLRPCHRR